MEGRVHGFADALQAHSCVLRTGEVNQPGKAENRFSMARCKPTASFSGLYLSFFV